MVTYEESTGKFVLANNTIGIITIRSTKCYGDKLIATAYEDRKKGDGIFEMNDYTMRKLVEKQLKRKKIPVKLAKLFTTQELLNLASGEKIDISEIKKRIRKCFFKIV